MRRNFVITITDNEQSMKSADRCVASGRKYGVDVGKWNAITPRTNIFQDMVEEANLNIEAFSTGYSRPENALACFLSHRQLWQYSVENKCEVLILEHDAVFVDRVGSISFDRCVTIGKPSYGKFNIPESLGTQHLVHKRYFGGAHAYIVNPLGAEMLLDKVATHSEPTDVYLNRDNFPFLQEHYPWKVEVNDSFTTIQQERGVYAKHNYEKGIKIIEA